MSKYRIFVLAGTATLLVGSLSALLGGWSPGLAIALGSAAALFAATLHAHRQRQRTLRQLTTCLHDLAHGHPVHALHTAAPPELKELVDAWNYLATTLPEHIRHLSRERALWRAILDHTGEGLLVVDPTGRVPWFNPTAARLLGVSQHTQQPLSLGTLVHHHRIIHLWQRCQTQGETQEDVLELPATRRTVRVRVIPLRHDDTPHALIVLEDITYVRQLETTRRDFISNISHELRTPLASLKAVVETLRDGALDEPTIARRFLTHIEREVDTMVQMVEELLELARIESGRLPLRFVPVPVTDIVMPVVERFQPQAERAHLHLSAHLPSPSPQVLADPPRAQRILANLLHNAIKFTPAGGEVQVTVTPRERDVCIAVRDTGVGIPADQLPRIFERFYKVDRARTGEGTGLGLAIAKHLTLAHGGRIWVESTEGEGSTFYFTLQRATSP